jgi:hypothetical protein
MQDNSLRTKNVISLVTFLLNFVAFALRWGSMCNFAATRTLTLKCLPLGKWKAY